MTPRQRDLLVAIDAYWSENGCSPSFSELRNMLQLSSKNGVSRLVVALEERGLITRRPNRPRCLELTPSGQAHVGRNMPPQMAAGRLGSELSALADEELVGLFLRVQGELGRRGMLHAGAGL